jgi:hypothetical protein
MTNRVVLESWSLAKRAWLFFVLGLIIGIILCVPLVWEGIVSIPECVLAWLVLSFAATLLLSPAAWLDRDERLVFSGLKVSSWFVPFHRRKCDSADSIVVWHMDHTATSGRNMPVGWYVGINEGEKQTLYVHGPDKKSEAEAFKADLIETLGL